MPSTDPLAGLSDDQLWNTQLLLMLACGRTHSALRKNRRQFFCFLFQNLKLESDLRGLPVPVEPFHVSQLKKGAL